MAVAFWAESVDNINILQTRDVFKPKIFRVQAHSGFTNLDLVESSWDIWENFQVSTEIFESSFKFEFGTKNERVSSWQKRVSY